MTKKANPMVANPAPVPLGGVAVTQFVNRLDQTKRHPVEDKPPRREGIDKGCREHIPLPDDQKKAENQGKDRELEKPTAESPGHILVGPGRETVGPDQGNADEQIVMKQPLPPRPMGTLGYVVQMVRALGVTDSHQLMT